MFFIIHFWIVCFYFLFKKKKLKIKNLKIFSEYEEMNFRAIKDKNTNKIARLRDFNNIE